MTSRDGAGLPVGPGRPTTPGRPSSLIELLGRRAGGSPDRVVYAFSPGGEGLGPTLTLGALDLRARAVAAWLQARGLEGRRVLLVFPPGLDFVAAFFGCLYAGAVAVPASTPRANRPMNRLKAVVDGARPDALLTTLGQLPAARQWLAQVPDLARAHWLGVEAVPDNLARLWRDPGAGPETLAFLQYTSGSTAAPKGVMVTHGNLLHNSDLIRQSFAADGQSRGVFWLPLFHDMGLIGGVIQTLYCDGTSTLMSPVSFLQRPVRWLEAISRTGATISGGPNFAYDLCARKVTDAQKANLDLSRWSVAFNGAEPVRAETLDRFAEAFAPCGFRREAFLPCYGLAESTLMVTAKRSGEPPTLLNVRGSDLEAGRAVGAGPGGPDVKTLVGSGRGFEGLRVEVVDPATAAPLPDGRVGEIWVNGPSVAAGYWDLPEATAETFRARLPGGDGSFLRTGDLGFLDRGELYVTGRLKDLMIVRGRNVYPQDVEWSASGAHPLTRAEGAAAFAVEVDGVERLVVVQEIDRPGKGVDPQEIVDAVRAAVAGQHDLDVHAVCLIKAMSLPKTSSGKVQRHACRAAYLAGDLDTIAASVRSPAERPPPVSATSPDRPAGEVERWLVARLASTLNMDPSAVDVRRPFAGFGLGSLQAVGLAGELEQWLGRPLSPTLVYDHPTVEALARHLAGVRDDARPLSEAADPAGPIAIVGIGCRFPGADGPGAFWTLLSDGVDAVGEPPAARRAEGRAGAKRAGFLERVDLFDAAFFGIAPREAVCTDPQQRLLLEVAWEALEDAGLSADGLRGADVGVFVGVSTNDYGRRRLAAEGAREAYAATGNALSVAANRVSYAFDFRGPSLAVDTACSSSLVAVHLACESLRRGEASLALAAGVSVILSGEVTETFAAAGFLSPDGRCKAFDASADGYVRGEGAGVVVLKPLARALADGDPVYAVVRGSAVNQDGRSNGLTAPNREAQEAVLRAAYRKAGVAPGEVDYVEAHGTGTLLGDPIEAAALAAVVGDGREPGRPCAIGSVKTNIGHLEAAAGIAGVIKVALSIDRGEIPASLHFRSPNPHIPFDALPIRVQNAHAPWPDRDRARLAGVSAFGFGGTNAHAVLGSAPARRAVAAGPAREAQLIPLSAQSPQALLALARSYHGLLNADGAPALADVAHSAGTGRSHHEHRLAVVARTPAEAAARLGAFLKGEAPAGRRPPSRRPRVAFVFSGQGSQWWGMGRGLIDTEPVVRDALDDLDRRFRPLLGWSILDELAADEVGSRLEETGYAQPVVFALQVALAALWKSWGVEPDAVAGHSLGEVAAAFVAGALALDDAVLIVAHRARLMQTAAGGGKTAAVALSAAEAGREVAADPDRLALAAVNGPNASVISGEGDAVLALLTRLRARGVFAKVLAGNCAFHGPQMDPLRGELRAALAGLRPRASSVSIVSTVTGRAIGGEELGPDYWAANLREMVRFSDAVSALAADGFDAILEVGPHPALGPATAETLAARGLSAAVLGSLRRGGAGREDLLGTLATLYALGFPVDWTGVVTGGRFLRLPCYPFQREPFWIDLAPEPANGTPGVAHLQNGNGHSHGNRHGSGNGYRNGHAPAAEPPDPEAGGEPAGFYEVVWSPRERTATAPLGAGTWIVYDDSLGAGAALRARLEAAGSRCVSVTRAGRFERRGASAFGIDPESVDDAGKLLDAVAAGGPVAGAVHLWNLDATAADRATPEGLSDAQGVGCGSVVALVRAAGRDRGPDAPRVWVVTAGAQPVGGSPGPLALAQAPVWGLGRSAALESARVWGGLIDLDPSDPAGDAPALADELAAGPAEDQVAFRQGRRFVARLARRQRLEHLPDALPVRADGTYLVTGGLGELGLKVARRLVDQGARRVVLVGRRGLPDRADWDALPAAGEAARKVAAVRAMERLGATVFVAAVDVADGDALAALFTDLRRLFPPLRGVVHAAGVVTTGALGSLEPSSLAGALRSKVAGTWALHGLTRDQPLDFFVAFSSVASVLGVKEADYAAANQFLDAFAHHRRSLGLPALSVNWGPWEGAGMAADAERARAFALAGVKPLRADDGLDALAELVASGVPQAVVAGVDWDAMKALDPSDGRRRLLDDLTAGRARPRQDASPTAGGRRVDWIGGDPGESREKLVHYLRGRLAAVLKLDPARVDTDRPIDSTGLDSLMAIELKNGVETDLGVSLPLSSLLQGPTLEDLAGRVFDQLSGSDTPPPAAGPKAATAGGPDSPLSSGQRALWSLHQFDPSSTAYNMVGAVRIAGPLDAGALRRAAQRLVDRHPSLRTTFLTTQGEPVQRVHGRKAVAFRFVDLSGRDDETLARRLAVEAERPFDLENGPLFRIHLFRRSGTEHALLLALHHVIADFWSIAVLLDELGRTYPAELSGAEPLLPALPVTYADFARWQASVVSGPEGEAHWSYWGGQLAGPLPVLNLPTDRPRPPVQSSRGATRLVHLDAALTPRLSALGRRRGASLYVTMLAAFHALLSRLSGQEDVIVGSPVVGRNRPELAGVVGYFVNTLPLRATVDPALTFDAFLDRVRATVLGALEHQDYPFAVLADRLQTVRDPGRSPVFQVMFVFQKAQRLDDRGFTSFVLRGEGTRMELGGFPVESIALETRSAQFDLTVQVAEDAGRLAVSAEYNTDLFDAGTIDRLLGHYRTLLEAAADDPGRSLGDLPILTSAERSQLALWNATEAPPPAFSCVTELIARRAAEAPDAPAVAASEGTLTYRQLDRRANRLAHRLRAMGVGPDVRVAVCAGRSSAAVVGILGVLKAGGAYVPLDPDYPAERLAFMIADSQAPVLLAPDAFLGRLPDCGARVVSLDDVPGANDHESDQVPEPLAGPGHLAYVIYTSGSTGTPKGVLVTRANLAHSTDARFRYYREPVASFLLVSSFAFDSSVAGLFWTLAQGGTLVLPGTGDHADPDALAALVRRHGVTHVLSVPSLYALLLEIAAASDLASLRTTIVAGEPCPRDLPARHHGALPWVALENEYGPTEATVWATAHRCLPDDSAAGPVPIGRPISNTRAYVLDARMNPVPAGVTGELYLGGAGLARGYHGRPELTAASFVADPFSGEAGSRLYRTGDLARYRPDGVIECLGRVDGQVKIRGYRVELGEVESALSAHPAVREAVAAARPEPSGETRLVAYLVPRAGEILALTELRAWMAARLPDAMVPSVFAVLDALPLSPNGKVDRASLPDPSASRLSASAGSEGPRNEVEGELARLAAGLLGVDRVGIHDNFFELGVDSIVAIQLVARAREAGLALAPADLFQNPTVAGLASVAVPGPTTSAAPPAELDPGTLERLARPGLTVEDAYPLTPLQEGMLAQALVSPGRGEYVQQLVCAVRGELDPSSLAEAWRRLGDRHAVLRTGFQWSDRGRPLQAVYRGVRPPLEVIDWRGLSPEDQENRLEDALRADRERGFDPSEPPLSRLAVFRLGGDTSRLVWTYHHLLFDGWSLQTVLHELLAVYGGVVSGEPVDLPSRAPFRDHVAWLSSQDPSRAEPFWRLLLKGFKAPTPLGIDRAAGSSSGTLDEPYDEHEIQLSAATTAGLLDLGRRRGLTPGTLVQGAWALLLGRYSGHDDVVFGTTVSGRSSPVGGIEGMVGLMINTLPARASIDPGMPVAAWLSRLQESLVEARRYEDSPLAMVQGWSEVPRGRPLFESLVIFENYPADDSLRAQAGGLGFGPVRVLERTHLPLTIMAFPGPRLRLRVVYDVRRFDAAAVDRMAGHLGCLLDAVAAGPDRAVGALPIAGAAEIRQILDQWNDTPTPTLMGEPDPARAAGAGHDLDGLSDEDVEALIGEYLGRDEAPDE